MTGQHLRDLRTSAAITQRKLAAVLGVGSASVSHMEDRVTEIPGQTATRYVRAIMAVAARDAAARERGLVAAELMASVSEQPGSTPVPTK
jgi:transcriptional regulator with XRE-family HTH domain